MFKIGDKVVCNKEFYSITHIKGTLLKGQIYTILESGFHYSKLFEIGYNTEYGNTRFDLLTELRSKKLKQLDECLKKEIK